MARVKKTVTTFFGRVYALRDPELGEWHARGYYLREQRVHGVSMTIASRLCHESGEIYAVRVKTGNLARYLCEGEYIHEVMPELDADQREFLISGTTPAEWTLLFSDEDDEENAAP